MIFSGLTFHQLSIFAERGMALNAALQGFQVAALVSAISVFVVGWLLDRVSIRLILAVTMTVEIGILLMLQVMAEPWHILPYGLLFGMSGGSFMAMDAVVWPKYFGRAHLGAIRGVTTTAMVVGAALGPFPMGLGLDYLGSYGPVLTAFTIFPLAIAVAAFFVQRPERKGQ
jgi:predicted MFS family arabinose efflux permease